MELVGATRDTLRLHIVGSAQQGAYRVEVTNPLGVANAAIASVTVVPAPTDPGGPDLAFYSGTGPNALVHALAVQADEKVLIGGGFSSVDGLPHGGLARFEPNGALDTTFQASAFGLVRSLVVRPNGKILAGGLFTSGNPVLVLAAQFNSDGSFDPAFQSMSAVNNSGSVFDMLVLPDDKLLVAGAFILPSSQGPRATPLERLQANGTLDPAFHLAFSPSAVVYVLAREPDNQVIIGGFFTSVGGVQRNHLARINPDGTVDQTLDPGVGPNGSIRAVAVQADGKLIVAGRFTRIGSDVRTRVARLTSNGTLDPSFDAGPFPSADDITALALQGDGKILIGSSFDDGTFAIARLHADGSLDGAFRTVALPAHPSRGPAGSVGHRSPPGWQDPGRRRFRNGEHHPAAARRTPARRRSPACPTAPDAIPHRPLRVRWPGCHL